MGKHDSSNCVCARCQKRKAFFMPEVIVEATEKYELVIFAGAGVSTEGKNVFPTTLFEELAYDLDKPKDATPAAFPDLVSEYCLVKGRHAFLRKIRDRIESARSFPEIYNDCTEFHRELANIYFIRDIITTNWDDFFEVECGAIPVLDEEDFAFWGLPQRKVLKIHGSIGDYSSIVASKEDYEAKYQRLEADSVGKALRDYLSRKTIVFLGYSFRDNELGQIIQTLRKKLHLPKPYVVTTSEPSNLPLDANVISTDATFFVAQLKEALIAKEAMLPDYRFPHIKKKLDQLIALHYSLDEFPLTWKPEMYFLLVYQDGLIHALERGLEMKKTGEYSHPCRLDRLINDYGYLREEALKKEIYTDVAYIDGYINGLIAFFVEAKELKDLPIFYSFDCEINGKSVLKYFLESWWKRKRNKKAYEYALKKTKDLPDNIVFHKRPFLRSFSEDECECC